MEKLAVKRLEAPVSDASLLSTREKIILLQGSKLNGCMFPPWKSAPLDEEFEEPYTDDTDFRFSAEQLKIFDGWQDPANVLRNSSMISTGKTDLVQDMTSDCSVVASLCAESARQERGYGKSVLFSIMYPSIGGKPVTSRNGKHVFKLAFNGCFRKVVIDHRLPASNSARALHVLDRWNPGLLWPALVEKAYLKIRGGYDFPGSNSGTDLWVLTGWIPEQIFLQSNESVPNVFWKRIYNAFNYGDVLITMGTGKLIQEEEQGLGLAGEHDYAVLDMKEEDDHRLFLLKNPWSEGGVWKGHINSNLNQSENGENSVTRPDPLVQGTFWIDINSVYQSFETIYLNWNPGLFSHRRDVHFTWDLQSLRGSRGSFDNNPQYSLYSQNGGTLWLLLNKHFQTSYDSVTKGSDVVESLILTPRVRDPITKFAKPKRIGPGYMSLYAFDSGGNRVVLSDGFVVRSPYVDAPNALLRLEMPPNTRYTIVISEQDFSTAAYNFTLSAFSTEPLFISQATERYPYSTLEHGAWKYSTAGGKASSPTYSTNPQYSLTLSESSDLTLFLEAESEEVAVHVKLIWAGGKRIAPQITTRDVVGDSGDYRRGCALATLQAVLAGTYTVVCSTFAQHQLGNFTLRARSMSECTLKPIPLESGRFVLGLPPVLFVDNDRVLAPLTVKRITRLCLQIHRAKTSRASSHSPLRIAIEQGQGPNKRIVLTSGHGDFLDASIIRTGDADILPLMCESEGGLWVVVDRVGGACSKGPEEVYLEILSTESGVQVGLWGQEVDEPNA